MVGGRCSYRKRRDKETQTRRKDGHIKTEAKIGVMLAQAKEFLGSPEARREGDGPSPRGFRGNVALPTP